MSPAAMYSRARSTMPTYLPRALQASVFDMYVNAGANAVRVLQRLLIEMGQVVAVDGVIGPQTVAATQAAFAAGPDHLADAYGWSDVRPRHAGE